MTRPRRIAPVPVGTLITIGVALATAGGAAGDPCQDPVGAIPAAERARYVTANELLTGGDAESAADYVELLLAAAPRSVAVLELAARVHRELGDGDRVEALVAELGELCPGRTIDLEATGPAGPLDEARSLYRSFLSAGSADDRRQLLGRATAAYEAFLDGGQGGGAAAEARHTLAVLYLYAGRLEPARDAYRWLAQNGGLQPPEVPEYLRVLRSLAHQGEGDGFYDEGAGLVEAWRERLADATRVAAERHLGFLALHLDRHADARRAFAAALAGDGGDGESHYGMAAALEREAQRLDAAGDRQGARGRRQSAMEHARQAVDDARYGEAARALLARLQFEG